MNYTLLFTLSGGLATLYAVIALFFLKFHVRSKDRLFLLFATAFFLLAAQRVLITVFREWGENVAWLYGLRLLAFVLILVAIIGKNRETARR
jgi:hypothetical protein